MGTESLNIKELQSRVCRHLINLGYSKGDDDYKNVISALLRKPDDSARLSSYSVGWLFQSICSNISERLHHLIMDSLTSIKGYSDKSSNPPVYHTFIGWLNPVKSDNEDCYCYRDDENTVYADIITHDGITKYSGKYFGFLLNRVVDIRYRNFALFVMVDGEIDHIIELAQNTGEYITNFTDIDTSEYNSTDILIKESNYYLKCLGDTARCLQKKDLISDFTHLLTFIKSYFSLIQIPTKDSLITPTEEKKDEDIIDGCAEFIEESRCDKDDVEEADEKTDVKVAKKKDEEEDSGKDSISGEVICVKKPLYMNLFNNLFKKDKDGVVVQADIIPLLMDIITDRPLPTERACCRTRYQHAKSTLIKLGITKYNLNPSNLAFREFLKYIKSLDGVYEFRKSKRYIGGISFI